MKKGLILEGGAMRGMFTAGILDVLMEHGIEFDGAIGVSAGAAFGCNYKSKQIGRAIRYNMKFCKDKRYGGFRVLLKTGNYYSEDFCYGEVQTKHDIFDFDTYESNPMDFYVVCTDVETGEPVYHNYKGRGDGKGLDWIRASASMPLVSQMVEIEGKKLLDGGIADAIPVKYFESLGYDRNIVVLTRPLSYRKKKSSLTGLFRWKYKDYPKLVEVLENRQEMYNKTLNYIAAKEKRGELLVIRPAQAIPVHRTERNPQKLKQAYEIGRQTALERIGEIREFLGA